MKIFEKGIVQLIYLILVVFLILAARKGRELNVSNEAPHKSRPQEFDCFDMGTGTATCLAKIVLKLYPLMKYIPDRQTGDSESLAEKQHLAPYIAALTDLVESLLFKRPTGEAVSKAMGVFVGDHVVSHVTKSLFGRWKHWGFRLGSFVGAYVGGKVGVLAYDVYYSFDYLHSFFSAGGGNIVASSVHKEL